MVVVVARRLVITLYQITLFLDKELVKNHRSLVKCYGKRDGKP